MSARWRRYPLRCRDGTYQAATWQPSAVCPRRDLNPHAPCGAPAPQAGVYTEFHHPDQDLRLPALPWTTNPVTHSGGKCRPWKASPAGRREPLAGTDPAAFRLRGERSAIELKGRRRCRRSRVGRVAGQPGAPSAHLPTTPTSGLRYLDSNPDYQGQNLAGCQITPYRMARRPSHSGQVGCA